jgi:hypothetical protein
VNASAVPHQPDPDEADRPRDDCANISSQYVVRARKAIQGYFGPDSTQYAQIGGTRQSDYRTGGPAGQGHDAAPDSISRDDRRRGGHFQSSLLMALADAMSATGGAWPRDGGGGSSVVFPCLRSGTNGRPTLPGRAGWTVSSWLLVPAPCLVTRSVMSKPASLRVVSIAIAVVGAQAGDFHKPPPEAVQVAPMTNRTSSI